MQGGSLLISATHRVNELRIPIEMGAQLGNVAVCAAPIMARISAYFVVQTGIPFLEITGE